MKLSRSRNAPQHSSRSGAALLLSVLVLFILIAIVFQIRISTMTDARIGRNDVGLTLIDRAISSAQWDVMEMLKMDGEAEGGGAGAPPDPGSGAGLEGQEGGSEDPSDSRKDEWATVQRTDINGIDLRIIVEAENSKYNVLNLLNEDEEEAEECFQRVVRIIDGFREGTLDDLSNREAEEMVRVMKQFMVQRNRTNWPQANLLTFDEKLDGLFLPMSMQDFLVLEGWYPHHFRSYRDSDDTRVPSLDQFLTVWSALGVFQDLQGQDGASPAGNQPEPEQPEDDSGVTAPPPGQDEDPETPAGEEGEASAPSGIGVNVNLAPAAVLAGLVDDRIVPSRFWTDLIEYRNLEEEDQEDDEDTEPIYDEYGEEVLDRRAFESLEELSEVRSWDDMDSEAQAIVMSLLETKSDVFTIYITARRDMSGGLGMEEFEDARAKAKAEEEPSGALVRTVRCVVWRKDGADGAEIITIIPWEVVETVPHEIEDYPDEY